MQHGIRLTMLHFSRPNNKIAQLSFFSNYRVNLIKAFESTVRTQLYSQDSASWLAMSKNLFTQAMNNHGLARLERCSNRLTTDNLSIYRPSVSLLHINLITGILHPQPNTFYSRPTVIWGNPLVYDIRTFSPTQFKFSVNDNRYHTSQHQI